jgi:O-acetyl-ADP-ribose deacetylase (regulator of RNase III)
MQHKFSNGKLLTLMVGDITRIPADAMVNAANSALMGGGGVDGAIHRAGGPSIMRELDRIRATAGGCPTGSAVATSAGLLPSRLVFHAVGPVYRDGKGGEPALLASCYKSCFVLAEQHSVNTISFPSISTGAYGFPIREAAGIALEEVRRALSQDGGVTREVTIVLFSEADYKAYANCPNWPA